MATLSGNVIVAAPAGSATLSGTVRVTSAVAPARLSGTVTVNPPPSYLQVLIGDTFTPVQLGRVKDDRSGIDWLSPPVS